MTEAPLSARRRLDAHAPAVVADYETGSTIAQIAARYGCSAAPVRRVLIEASVPIRRRGRRSPVAGHEDDIARRYLAGWSLAAVAASFGADPKTVARALDRRGVARRPPGGRTRGATPESTRRRPSPGYTVTS